MPPLALRVTDQRLLRGCSAGLAEPTALVSVAVDGGLDRAALARVRAGVDLLCPDQPLFGIGESDWPTAFLADPDAADSQEKGPLGQWVVALTVALQRWARDPVWRGRVLDAEPDRLRLAIPWRRAGLFTDTLGLALRLLELWAQPPNDEQRGAGAAIQAGMQAARLHGLAPGTLRSVQAAVARGIPFDVLPGWVQFGWGEQAEKRDQSFTGHTGFIAAMIAKDKMRSVRILAGAGIPVPRGEVVSSIDEAQRVAAELGWPVVIKPTDQEQGRGVVPDIRTSASLHRAFDAAAAFSGGHVIVEKHIPGDDHRLLIVRGRLLAAARRTPGGVTGDGVRSITALLELLNADPRRGEDHHSLLKKVSLDSEALECLADENLVVDSVPQAGRWIRLRRTANIGTGGTAVDVTPRIHPDNLLLAQRAARLIGLDIAGVDFLTPDISRSWREVGGAVCEVNAQPGLRPHWLAEPQRDIDDEILDILFRGRPSRIPTAAITGTNGKSTTALMLHHIWTVAGKLAGVCTTQGVWIGDDLVRTDNLSGFGGARMILNDPGVQVGVFEMPRKGLIYLGHACDRYDVAALLNVSDDHIGVDGIETIEQMAELKSEVLARAHHAIVVNADDPLCMAMRARAGTDRHILVTSEPNAPTVVQHRGSGGEVVFLGQNGGDPWIMLATGESETPLMPVSEVAAAMNGLLRFNVINAMFAAALGWSQGIDSDTVRRALGSFRSSRDQNPGRFNVIEGLPFQLILDYGHNPEGVREICSVAQALPVTGRRILVTQWIGNRHASHFVQLAPVVVDAFDEIVLSCDPGLIMKNPEYTGDDPVGLMLSTGRQFLRDYGAADERIIVEADPAAAVRTTLERARPGDLVILLSDPYEAFAVIDEFTGRRVGG